ncbi:MAG: hypothetical protein H6581_00635 [Bacteroidia bacterium]|nr:hypothetical protein [Bacteroidia bacterium]
MVLKSWSQTSLPEVRNFYGAAIENSDSADLFLDFMRAYPRKDGIMLAYLGSAEALVARHAWNPLSKMDWLGKANKTFDQAVALDPFNAEIRFLRFCVQHYVPGFLGFSKNIDQDVSVIVNYLETTTTLYDDPELYRNIIQFMIETERCTPAELRKLESLKSGSPVGRVNQN